VITDITDRRLADRELRDSAELMRRFLATTTDAFLLADTTGRIVDANPVYCDLVGWSVDELRQRRVQDIEARLSPDDVRRRIDRMVARGHDRFETCHRSRDGRMVHLAVNAVLISQDVRPLVAAFMRALTDPR